MSPEQLNNTEHMKSEKEIRWEDERKRIEETADRLGFGIDEGIKESVIAFNLMGFPTSGSCEGHVERGLSAPWIEVRSEDKPYERFVGERDVIQSIADKYGVLYDETKSGRHAESHREASLVMQNYDETPEYKAWEKNNEVLHKKMSEHVDEFYQGRAVDENVRIVAEDGARFGFRVHNGGKDYVLFPEKSKDEFTDWEKAELATRLSTYQEEMRQFTYFLKKKFFEE